MYILISITLPYPSLDSNLETGSRGTETALFACILAVREQEAAGQTDYSACRPASIAERAGSLLLSVAQHRESKDAIVTLMCTKHVTCCK
jgi:hypothetical protein